MANVVWKNFLKKMEKTNNVKISTLLRNVSHDIDCAYEYSLLKLLSQGASQKRKREIYEEPVKVLPSNVDFFSSTVIELMKNGQEIQCKYAFFHDFCESTKSFMENKIICNEGSCLYRCSSVCKNGNMCKNSATLRNDGIDEYELLCSIHFRGKGGDKNVNTYKYEDSFLPKRKNLSVWEEVEEEYEDKIEKFHKETIESFRKLSLSDDEDIYRCSAFCNGERCVNFVKCRNSIAELENFKLFCEDHMTQHSAEREIYSVAQLKDLDNNNQTHLGDNDEILHSDVGEYGMLSGELYSIHGSLFDTDIGTDIGTDISTDIGTDIDDNTDVENNDDDDDVENNDDDDDVENNDDDENIENSYGYLDVVKDIYDTNENESSKMFSSVFDESVDISATNEKGNTLIIGKMVMNDEDDGRNINEDLLSQLMSDNKTTIETLNSDDKAKSENTFQTFLDGTREAFMKNTDTIVTKGRAKKFQKK